MKPVSIDLLECVIGGMAGGALYILLQMVIVWVLNTHDKRKNR